VADEVISEFLAEASEILDVLERDLVAVDTGELDPPDVVAGTFRAFHTLKGTSGFLGFEHLGGVAHAGEDLLCAIREGSVQWTRPVTDVLLQVLDALRAIMAEAARTEKDGDNGYPALVAALRSLASPAAAAAAEPAGKPASAAPPAPPPEAPPAPPPAPPLAEEPPRPSFRPTAPPPTLVRPSTPRPPPPAPAPPAAAERAAPPSASPAPSEHVAAAPEKSRSPPPEAHGESGEGAGTLRVPVPVLDRLMSLVGELVLARNQLICQEATREDARLGATTQRIHQLTTGLQEAVMKARMQPIDNVFSRLPRVARDTAQACGKQVRLALQGNETELDKTLLEAIKDPLTHLVRNSVDHGIERAEARLAAGKPAEGTVTVRAFQDGGQVIVEIEDDGGGVNVAKVRAKAVSLGLVGQEEAERLSERETIELVFRPGFSTADAVSQISGRGVGMDVVRTNVERIGGSVEMVSTAGRGSVCRIRVPLTLLIVPALIVASGGERYAVPQANLVELVRVAAERESQMVVDVHGSLVLRLRGTLLPLLDLGKVLGTGSAARAADGALSVVVLGAEGRQFGFLVDEVADTEEIVVKALGRRLQALGAFSGATVRGDGRVALVLDVAGIARRSGLLAEADARAAASAQATRAAAKKPYLILRGRDDGRLAIPLSAVARIEEIAPERVERVGGAEAVQYRGSVLPLVRVAQALTERRKRPRAPEARPEEKLQVVVQEWAGREVGLVVESILDVAEEDVTVDPTRARPGVAGCAVIQGRITEVLDTAALLQAQMGPTQELLRA